MKTRGWKLLITVLCLLAVAPTSRAAQEKDQKVQIWSKCVQNEEICVWIHIVKGPPEDYRKKEAVKPRFSPPTVVEGEDAAILVEVTSTGEMAGEMEVMSDTRPAEIRPLDPRPLIERETVSQKKLKELIPDPEVMGRLLQGKPLESLAITITHHDFEVVVKKVSGETVVRTVASIQVAKAEGIAEDTDKDCPLPSGALRAADPPDVAYTLPEKDRVIRTGKTEAKGWDPGTGYGFLVGPHIRYLKKAGKRMRLRECYNRYGELHGVKTEWYENGHKKIECSYRDGKPNGACLRWYQNGQMEQEEQFRNGKKHGAFKYWDTDGQLVAEKNYVEGLEHGTWKYWGTGRARGPKKGLKHLEEVYEKGQMVKEIQYHWKEGWKASETPYKNGKKHGLKIHWNKNGRKVGETPYVNGKEHGIETSWDENGKVISQTEYRDGKRIKTIK